MTFGELNDVAKHKDFKVFNDAELVVGIAIPGGNTYTRKQIAIVQNSLYNRFCARYRIYGLWVKIYDTFQIRWLP